MADISIPDVRQKWRRESTILELSDLDALYGDYSVCPRLFPQIHDSILSLTDFLLLCVSMFERRRRHEDKNLSKERR